MKTINACPVTAALSVIGGKWKVIILWHLQGEVKRFGELQKSIQGISQKMLTQELRDLEESGLVSRKVYPVVPPRVEYRVTELGVTLKPVMEHLKAWGSEYQRRAKLEKEALAQASHESQTVSFGKSETPVGVHSNRLVSVAA